MEALWEAITFGFGEYRWCYFILGMCMVVAIVFSYLLWLGRR